MCTTLVCGWLQKGVHNQKLKSEKNRIRELSCKGHNGLVFRICFFCICLSLCVCKYCGRLRGSLNEPPAYAIRLRRGSSFALRATEDMTAGRRTTSHESRTAKFGIIRDVRPSNTMRSTAPFAVSAAPAEAGHDMNAEAAYTVEKFTVADPFVPR